MYVWYIYNLKKEEEWISDYDDDDDDYDDYDDYDELDDDND